MYNTSWIVSYYAENLFQGCGISIFIKWEFNFCQYNRRDNEIGILIKKYPSCLLPKFRAFLLKPYQAMSIDYIMGHVSFNFIRTALISSLVCSTLPWKMPSSEINLFFSRRVFSDSLNISFFMKCISLDILGNKFGGIPRTSFNIYSSYFEVVSIIHFTYF